jgi:hypothetical protein
MAHRVVWGAFQRTRVPGAAEIIAGGVVCAQTGNKHDATEQNTAAFKSTKIEPASMILAMIIRNNLWSQKGRLG